MASNPLAIVPDDPATIGHAVPMKRREIALTPRTLPDLLQLGGMLLKSGLMPDGIRSPEAAAAVVLKGIELDIPPMAAIEGITIIKGKPTCGAHLMLALIRRDYGAQAIRVADSTAQRCLIEWRQPGWPGVQSYEYTEQDARTAGLWGANNWARHPKAMLRVRCISAVAKMAFPECIGGMYTPDELGADVTVTDAGDVVIDAAARVTAAEVVEPGGDADRGFLARIATAATLGALHDVAEEMRVWGGAGPAHRAAYQARARQLADPERADGDDDSPVSAGDPGTKALPGGITEPQMRKLWATATEKLGKETASEALHAIAAITYGKGPDPSLRSLTREEASELIDYLDGGDADGLREDLGPMLFEHAKDRGQAELPTPATEAIEVRDIGEETAFEAAVGEPLRPGLAGMPDAERDARDWGA